MPPQLAKDLSNTFIHPLLSLQTSGIGIKGPPFQKLHDQIGNPNLVTRITRYIKRKNFRCRDSGSGQELESREFGCLRVLNIDFLIKSWEAGAWDGEKPCFGRGGEEELKMVIAATHH